MSNYEEVVKLLNTEAIEKSVYTHIFRRKKKKLTGLSFCHEIGFKILAAWSIRELNLKI